MTADLSSDTKPVVNSAIGLVFLVIIQMSHYSGHKFCLLYEACIPNGFMATNEHCCGTIVERELLKKMIRDSSYSPIIEYSQKRWCQLLRFAGSSFLIKNKCVRLLH